MIKLSIVVPVYNVEKYLDECIKSILSGEYKDFELILVDDGSTDNSPSICDDLSNNDSRIKVIHKANGGLMSAWKCGVKVATGEYVGFVDSDDYIDSNMYSKMLEVTDKFSPEIVVSALIKEYSDGTSLKENIYFDAGLYDENNIKNNIFPHLVSSEKFHTRGISPNRVTKLIKRELLLNIIDYCDESVSIGEDLLTTFSCVTRAKSIYIMDNFYPYHYRINNDSMIMKFNKDKYLRVANLKNAMLRVNETSSYDFTSQIHSDYIDLVLRQFEMEVKGGKESNSQLKKRLKEIANSVDFTDSMKFINKNYLSKKDKLYLFLIKHKMYGLMVTIRKLK